jgi:hypothetical protein
MVFPAFWHYADNYDVTLNEKAKSTQQHFNCSPNLIGKYATARSPCGLLISMPCPRNTRQAPDVGDALRINALPDTVTRANDEPWLDARPAWVIRHNKKPGCTTEFTALSLH